MRVLYFHQHFTTRAGSSGTRSYEMARHLISNGHEVTMVCGSSGVGNTGLTQPFVRSRREGVVDGIRVIEFDLPYFNRIGFVKRSWIFIRFALRSIGVTFREKYDVVFATSTPLTAALPGIVASRLRRKKFVFEVRDLWPELPKAMGVINNRFVLWAMGVLERSAYRSSTHCIGLAPGIVEGIARYIDRSKVSFVPNGCDLDLFKPAGDYWRPETIDQDAFLAVFAGAHGPANGLDAVLDAAAKLKELGRMDIHLLLIGEGKLKPDLVQRAKDENLDNVTFHGLVDKQQIAALLRSSDVGMQVLANVPAFYQGTSPNKFFDYIASGLPVLNNYPGWLAGLIEENACGKVVPPDDPTAFAAALVELADNADERRLMGERARRLAEEQFERGDLAEKFANVLTQAAANG